MPALALSSASALRTGDSATRGGSCAHLFGLKYAVAKQLFTTASRILLEESNGIAKRIAEIVHAQRPTHRGAMGSSPQPTSPPTPGRPPAPPPQEILPNPDNRPRERILFPRGNGRTGRSMRMSSRKLNWVLGAGIAALSGMGACGGRTSGWEDQAAGVPGAGGTSGRGGTNSRAGTGQGGGSLPLGGGNAQGGKLGMGGWFGVAGSFAVGGAFPVAGGPNACQPSALFCEKNNLLQCSSDGSAASIWQECPDGTYCEAGARACSCAPERGDCDAKPGNGCETKIMTDRNHCGDCNSPCAKGLSCSDGACTGGYTFSGVATNVPIEKLAGWSQCFIGSYGDSVPISKVLASCTQAQLMMACRQAGSSTLQVAAYAPRNDVLFDTGPGNSVHNANGVGWYFSENESWGFAPLGAAVARGSCDVLQSLSSDSRLCWHTLGGGLDGGWRCGADTELNGSVAFERLLFQAP